MDINKQTCQLIRDRANAALQPLAAELGITINIGNGTFDPGVGTFTAKFEVSNPDSGRLEWERNCTLYGFAPEDHGTTFYSAGDDFIITGINPRAKTMPVLATRVSDGKTFKFATTTVHHALNGRVHQ